MDDLKTDETCDKCQIPFQILITDFEQAMKDDLPILCPGCNTVALNEQVEAEKLPDVCFKYKTVRLGVIQDYAVLNKAGSEGWELIAVDKGQAYFKIGYFREAK